MPFVFLYSRGDPFWLRVHEFVDEHLVARGLVAAADTGLYLVTDSAADAAAEVLRFYRNYQSMRYVGDLLVIRMLQAPSPEQLDALNTRFGHLCKSGVIRIVEPFDVERREHDALDTARIAFHFAKHGYGDLRELIDTLNGFAAA